MKEMKNPGKCPSTMMLKITKTITKATGKQGNKTL